MFRCESVNGPWCWVEDDIDMLPGSLDTFFLAR